MFWFLIICGLIWWSSLCLTIGIVVGEDNISELDNAADIILFITFLILSPFIYVNLGIEYITGHNLIEIIADFFEKKIIPKVSGFFLKRKDYKEMDDNEDEWMMERLGINDK